MPAANPVLEPLYGQEPIVETLDEDAGEELDPEAEYAIAGVVGETGGLEVMMDVLARSKPLLRVRECAALLLKLLQHCCKISANRYTWSTGALERGTTVARRARC